MAQRATSVYLLKTTLRPLGQRVVVCKMPLFSLRPIVGGAKRVLRCLCDLVGVADAEPFCLQRHDDGSKRVLRHLCEVGDGGGAGLFWDG